PGRPAPRLVVLTPLGTFPADDLLPAGGLRGPAHRCEDDAYANLVLSGLLRRHRVSGRDAAFTTELFYGSLRAQGRLDAIIAACVDRDLRDIEPELLDVMRLGAYQLLDMTVAPHAATSETVALA